MICSQNSWRMHKQKKILIFGAGKIGRSFVGQLFSLADYEIVFVEAYSALTDSLNGRQSYTVIIRDSNHPDLEQILEINNIRAVHTSDVPQILKEIVEADIIATSVGKAGLAKIAVVLAEGLKLRYSESPDRPVDIIIAENIRNADSFLEGELRSGGLDPIPENFVGLIETSIGKMVPVMTREQMESDPLAVYAEPYNSLILDKRGFQNPVPEVQGLSPKNNMKAWVDRKLFIHNMGHAALAYQSSYHHPELVYTWEALEIPALHKKVRDTMFQSAKILKRLYPDEFTDHQLAEHVDDLLERFANKSLGDTIFRVGSDLSRKLGGEDRLMVPILAGLDMKVPYDLILEAWVKGCSFKAKGEDGKELETDLSFKQKYKHNFEKILREHCNINPEETSSIMNSLEKLIL